MSEAVVAKRYADALFQLGTEKDSLDKLVEELRVVDQVFTENKDLHPFLMHPRINITKKKQLIEDVFQGISRDIVNTMKILVDRHRMGIIPAMIDHFIELVNDAKGIAKAVVYSVRELSDSEKNDLKSTFAKRFQKNAIEIENVVDPSILGGLRIRVGNTILDGSIRGKLHRLERNLKL